MQINDMRDKKGRRYLLVFVSMIAALLLLALVNFSLGSTSIPLKALVDVILGRGGDSTAATIITDIRMPRVLAAIILGGGLSVSGFLLQTFFGNPIAGPYVLGISSGAKLTVALAMIGLLSKGIVISSLGMIIAAFLGSLISMGFVIIISGRVKNASLLVVCGVMIGYICSAITDFVVTFADDSNIVNLHNWSLGSFSGISWTSVKVSALITFFMLTAAFFLSKPISAYQLGESYASNMGVNIKALRVSLILISSLLSASVTAFAGPISFVGIAVPHLVKGLFKTARPILLIPGCFLGGALVTLFCDGIARTVFAPTEVSISSVTAVFLVPVVIYIMLKKPKHGA